MEGGHGDHDQIGPLLRWWLPVGAALGAFAAWQTSVGRTYRAEAAIAVALMWMIATAFWIWPRIRWLLPAVTPLLVAAGCGVVYLPGPASAAALAGAILLALQAGGISAGRLVDAVVAALTTAIRAAAGGAVFILLILPGWGWARLRRRDPIRPRVGPVGPAWTPLAAAEASDRSLGTRPTQIAGPRPHLAGKVAWGVGCIVLILAADFGIGWTWDQAFPTDPPPPPPAPSTDTTTTAPRRVEGIMPRDARADSKALQAYPWREQYFDDLQRTTSGYWPFTETRPNDYQSRYINLEGWIRRSYQPPGQGARPTVWMFGGSTTWGEGQRDEYTIASYLSRLAEQAGTPIRIDNYGQRGWTHFQEMILYEQQLALEPDPDFAIFYDGANETTTQSLLDVAVPTHTLAYTYAQMLGGFTVATQTVDEQGVTEEPDVGEVVRDAYQEHSAVKKVIDYFQGTAGAAPEQDDPDRQPSEQPTGDGAGDEFTEGQLQSEDGSVYDYEMTDQDAIDAGRVYERGKQLTLALSEQYEVKPFLFWQPMLGPSPRYLLSGAELTDSTIDLSEVLKDHNDVFIDGGHTNEEGARLAAVEIWKRVGPSIQKWYREHEQAGGEQGG